MSKHIAPIFEALLRLLLPARGRHRAAIAPRERRAQHARRRTLVVVR
ncbi:hypothetical protein ACFW1M_01520 [Streptomyces inhibens]|nr:hypothetical protein [Streptomyces inhibens]